MKQGLWVELKWTMVPSKVWWTKNLLSGSCINELRVNITHNLKPELRTYTLRNQNTFAHYRRFQLAQKGYEGCYLGFPWKTQVHYIASL